MRNKKPRAITSKVPLCKRKEYNKSNYSNEDRGQYFLSISPKILSKMEQDISPKSTLKCMLQSVSIVILMMMDHDIFMLLYILHSSILNGEAK